MLAALSSGDLARATGNTVRTIRFYEEEGLLRPAEVSEGGHRRYTEEDLERLRLIIDLRELGLALCEIPLGPGDPDRLPHRVGSSRSGSSRCWPATWSRRSAGSTGCAG